MVSKTRPDGVILVGPVGGGKAGGSQITVMGIFSWKSFLTPNYGV